MAANWKSWPIIGWFAFRERTTLPQAGNEQGEEGESSGIVDVTRLCDIRLDALVDLAVTAVLIESIEPAPDSNYRVDLKDQVLFREDDGWKVVPITEAAS